jgi:hypothetical protein
MNRRNTVVAMFGTALLYLAVTGIVSIMAEAGDLSWAAATEFVKSFTSFSSLVVGGVIGFHLSAGYSE